MGGFRTRVGGSCLHPRLITTAVGASALSTRWGLETGEHAHLLPPCLNLALCQNGAARERRRAWNTVLVALPRASICGHGGVLIAEQSNETNLENGIVKAHFPRVYACCDSCVF